MNKSEPLRCPRRRSARGTVTAEAAVVLPLVAAFAVSMVWVVSASIGQILVVDAARDAARELARGEDAAAVVAQARRTAPDGARVTIHRSGGLVTVEVSATQTPPGWLLAPIPDWTVRSSSTVEVE